MCLSAKTKKTLEGIMAVQNIILKVIVRGFSAASGRRTDQFDPKKKLQLYGISFEDKKANIEQ
jgi:hypothetical protein